MATSQYVDLEDTGLNRQSNKGAFHPLSYTFAIVTYNNKRQNTNTSGYASANKDIPISVSEGDKLNESRLPTSQPMNQSEANSLTNYQSKSNNIRAEVQIDTYNSNLYIDPSSHDFDTQYQQCLKG